MDIIKETQGYVSTQILPKIKPQHRELFRFGMKALSLTQYVSLGSNARQIVENAHTASSKMYRLMSNKTLIENFHTLLKTSGFVKKESLINVDFSTFCGFQALVFAAQTSKGRAIPVWNDCITYPITEEGSQNIFVLEQLKKFGKTIGFFPRFVFDRGFWIPCVMQFMLQKKIPFYLRIKQGQHLEWVTSQKEMLPLRKSKIRKRRGKNKKKTARQIGWQTKDAQIILFGHKMRLIVSPPPPKQTNPKKKQNTQRWYVITNDLTSRRSVVLQIYKTRFEIEESFKDMKHIQKLKVLHINNEQTFTKLLWFASLAFWIAFWIEIKVPRALTECKKKLSFFRHFWERFQFALRQPRLSSIMSTAPL